MNENIHSEDEPFQKAYARMEEDPSPEVWEKINARLDSQDAVYYRNRFVTWKRIACLLLLLLGVGILYQVFHSEEQPVSRYNQSGTVSGSRKPGSTQKRTAGMDAAQPSAKASVDTTNSLQDDKSNRMAAGKVYNRRHNLQPLPASAAAENTDALLLVRPQTPAYSPDRKLPVTDSFNRQFLPQQVPNHISYNLIPNQKLQMKDTSRIDPGSRDNDAMVNGFDGNTIPGKDSAFQSALAVDSPDKTQNGVSAASAKKAIRLHKPFAGGWSVTPFISADVTGYELDDDDHEQGGGGNQPEHHRQEIEERETHQFSFSAGAFAKWQFSPRISIRTGIVYSNISIGIQPQTLYASQDNSQSISYKFITSSGYAYVKPVFSTTPATGDSINAEISHHHLQFLSVPLTVGYRFSTNKRLTVTPGIGLSANLLLSTRIKTEVNEDTDKEMIIINRLEGLRKTYLSFMADADINYFLSRRFSVSLLPMFKYAINPITKDNVVRTFPYSVSIGAGITYRF